MAQVEYEEAYTAAIKRNILNNARKTWRGKTPRFEEIEQALDAGRVYNDNRYGLCDYKDNFIGSLARAFDGFGKLTEKQSDAILKNIDTRDEKRAEWEAERAKIAANSKHVGEVGKRIQFDNLLVESIITVDKPKFSYYDIDFKNIVKMRDVDGNALVWITTAYYEFGVGDKINIKATIKQLGAFRGEAQTVLTRVKVI